MKLEKNTVQKILQLYQICAEVTDINCMVNIDFIYEEERIVKYYARVFTEEENYVLKLLRLPMCPDIVLEKQAELSQRYRENGIPTPKSYKDRKERYCSDYEEEGLKFKILLEEDVGEVLNTFSKEVILQMAELLGKMHCIALENKWNFRTGSFYREFSKGKTEYLQLWERTGTEFLPQPLLNEIVEKYNACLEQMKQSWSNLPIATVQGDMYWMNLMVKEDKLAIIDYDRAGDEVLLSDVLITWFRILFDPVIQEAFPEVKEKGLWTEFLKAYEKERTLTDSEKLALADQYTVFGIVYGTKKLVELAVKDRQAEAAEGLAELLEILR